MSATLEERMEQIVILLNANIYATSFKFERTSSECKIKTVHICVNGGSVKTAVANTWEECIESIYEKLFSETEKNLESIQDRIDRVKQVQEVGVG